MIKMNKCDEHKYRKHLKNDDYQQWIAGDIMKEKFIKKSKEKIKISILEFFKKDYN